MAAHHILTMGILASSTQPGFPVWLPTAPSGDRPLVYADFVNGHYWANNSIQSDAIFVQNAGWSTYDSANIIPGSGLSPAGNNGNPVIDPAYLGTALTGCTIVGEMTIGAGAPPFAGQNNIFEVDMFDVATYTFDSITEIQWSHPADTLRGTALCPDESAFVFTTSAALSTPVKLATTLTLVNATTSFLGSTIAASVGAPVGVSPDNIGIGLNTSTINAFLTTFIVYAPQPDIDLPTLSTP